MRVSLRRGIGPYLRAVQDLHLREKIWRAHIPRGLKVSADINWRAISADFELSGSVQRCAPRAEHTTAYVRCRLPVGRRLHQERHAASVVPCCYTRAKGAYRRGEHGAGQR